MASALALAVALIGGVVLALLVLAVPVHVTFRVEGIGTPSARVNLRWLFGLLRFGIDLPDAGKPPRRPRRARPTSKRPAPARASSPGRSKRFLAVLQRVEFRQRVLRLARSLVAAAHLNQLRLQLRLGLGDPADTGRLWAVLGPVSAWAQNLRHAQVRIEPEFNDAMLEFQAQGQARLVPLQLLVLAAAFVLSPEALRAWRSYRGADG